MRRLFILQKSVLYSNTPTGTIRYAELFAPQTGHHYIDIGDGFVLLSGELANEAAEEVFHAHPEITSTPHPTLEGNVTIAELLREAKHAHRKFKPAHLDALNAHPALKIEQSHTVWDLHDQARKIHPLVRLTNVY